MASNVPSVSTRSAPRRISATITVRPGGSAGNGPHPGDSRSPAESAPGMKLDDIEFLRDLGFRIRERRVARGLTRAQLGARCNLHRTFIGPVERGERNVSILNLR